MRCFSWSGLAMLGAIVGACADQPTTPPVVPLHMPSLSLEVTQAVHGSAHFSTGGELRTFTFSAQKRADGSVTGEFEIIARQVDRITHGRITCMTVFGDAAWIGVVIERDNSGVSTGAEGRFRVVDLGQGAGGTPDLVSLLAFNFAPGFAQSYCDNTPPFPPLNVTEAGEVVITQPGSSSFTSSVVVPIDIGVFIECAMNGAGEFVALTGNLHSLFHFTDDGAGGFHVMSEVNPQGVSGTGTTSGDNYQGTGVGVSNFNAGSLRSTDTFINNFRIIGQGSGNNLLIHHNFHVTFNANGDLTAFVDNFSGECR